jgi:hypothetical protein
MIPAGSFREVAMRLPLSIAVALLAAMPAASALTIQTNTSSSVDGPRVADPDDVRQNLRDQPTNDGGYTTKIGGTTLHFGISQPNGGASGGNNWFLDSPASRTVPSQAR